MPIWTGDTPLSYFAFGLPKNSILKKFITLTIIKDIESGSMRLKEQRYLPLPPNCSPLWREAVPLTFKKICTIFLVIASGLILSSLSLILEKLFYQKSEPVAPERDLNSSIRKLNDVLDSAFQTLKENDFPLEDILLLQKIKTGIKESSIVQAELHKEILK